LPFDGALSPLPTVGDNKHVSFDSARRAVKSGGTDFAPNPAPPQAAAVMPVHMAIRKRIRRLMLIKGGTAHILWISSRCHLSILKSSPTAGLKQSSTVRTTTPVSKKLVVKAPAEGQTSHLKIPQTSHTGAVSNAAINSVHPRLTNICVSGQPIKRSHVPNRLPTTTILPMPDARSPPVRQPNGQVFRRWETNGSLLMPRS
jgi:hypothetical protein